MRSALPPIDRNRPLDDPILRGTGDAQMIFIGELWLPVDEAKRGKITVGGRRYVEVTA